MHKLHPRFVQGGADRVSEPFPVRAFPVNAAAAGARVELVVVLPGLRRQRRIDRFLRDLMQPGVAVNAA